MILREWKPFNKNSLRGFATVELTNGLVIGEMPIHNNSGRVWANLPAVPQMENGIHRKVDGKGQWKKILHWKSRDISDRFSDEVIGLIREKHADDLR